MRVMSLFRGYYPWIPTEEDHCPASQERTFTSHPAAIASAGNASAGDVASTYRERGTSVPRPPVPERKFVQLHVPVEMIASLERYVQLAGSNKSHVMLTAIAKQIGYVGPTGTVARAAPNPAGHAATLKQARS